jgi:hypothetical protein
MDHGELEFQDEIVIQSAIHRKAHISRRAEIVEQNFDRISDSAHRN